MEVDVEKIHDGSSRRKKLKPLLKKVREQMEFYFSEPNLRKDRFLKQQIDATDDGYISVELFLKFNKISKLTSESSVIVQALSKSTLINVSEDRTMLKRSSAITLPKHDPDDCTVYVECLPRDVSHDWLKTVFSRCGDVAYVSIPRYKSTGDCKGFAFIEYVSPACVDKACELLNNPPKSSKSTAGIFPKTHKGRKIPVTKTEIMKLKPHTDEQPHSHHEKQSSHTHHHHTSSHDSNTTTNRDKQQQQQQQQQHHEQDAQQQKHHRHTQNVSSSSDNPDINKTSITNQHDHRGHHHGDTAIVETHGLLSETKKRKHPEIEDNGGKENTIKEPPIKHGRIASDQPKDSDVTKTGKRLDDKQQLKSADNPEIRVITKKEWVLLKREYLQQQKANMSKLKEEIKAMKLSLSTNNENTNTDMMEINKTGTKTIDREPLQFLPNVVLKLTTTDVINEPKILKESLSRVASVAYVDVKKGDYTAYVRCTDSESATTILSQYSTHATSLILIQGEEEKKYWEKLNQDRVEKLSGKKRFNIKRGSEKLRQKADNMRTVMDHEPSQHIRFSDDD